MESVVAMATLMIALDLGSLCVYFMERLTSGHPSQTLLRGMPE